MTPPVLWRARPVLGTLVEIRVEGLAATAAESAVRLAFAEVEAVHACMSFHAADSDLSRLHATPLHTPVAVDERTYAVLACALEFAARSNGRFDPGIGAQMVTRGFLPAPRSAYAIDARASWRDVELMPDGHVRLRRGLWLDLGGIAKGYAVDRALACLRASGATAAGINAGGDLAVFGPLPQLIHVRDPAAPSTPVPLFDLSDGAVATSAGYFERRRVRGGWRGPHLDAARQRGVGTHRAVSVAAPSCMHADALTKIALADAAIAARLLSRYDAHACAYDRRGGWRRIRAA